MRRCIRALAAAKRKKTTPAPTDGAATDTTDTPGTTDTDTSGTSTPFAAHRAVGNDIFTATGSRLRVAGVNYSGTEYACWQGWGIFDGPRDLASVQAIARWNANTVNVSLNESCWLQVNGVPATYSGATYRQAIKDYVNLVTGAGLHVNLRLSWITSGVPDMPDRQHAPAFWRSVAAMFKDNPRVMFDLAAEPHPDGGRSTEAAWRCWRDGGTCPNLGYEAAGMQELVDAVRSTGATNLLVLTGVAWGNDVSRWLEFKPHDPLDNLAAGVHIYQSNVCNSTACWDARVAPVAAKHPLIATEAGEAKTSASGPYVVQLMKWLDAHEAGYVIWTWNRWRDYAMNLVSDWTGTPTIYGSAVFTHFHTRSL